MAYTDDFLYQIQLGNPIEEVIKSYVHLVRKGRNYVCSCPFHAEKTPSCTIYTDTQSFYCFGCGAGGDVITFIRKIENLDYFEAVKLLAQRAGLEIPDEQQNKNSARIKARILEINRETALFYYKNLLADPNKLAIKYLATRGLSPQIIKKYGLGYAPNSWDKLKNHLLSLGYSEEELVTANVCSKKNENVFDMFRNRVMFPIIDLRGNIIAFGGRVLDDRMPKYLNTSDTPVFKKSRNLFSLNFAKNASVKKLILAEGYMDVIAINQAGFENVVATLGTALTSEQANIMKNYADEVIIAYDSDNAGQKATQKAINLLGQAGITTRIIKMNGAKDPDEYIKKYGPDKFKLLLEQSQGAINFELEKCKNGVDIATETGRIQALKRCVKVLSQISDNLERDIYISKISKEYEISLDVLKAQVNTEINRTYNRDKLIKWKSIVNQSHFKDEVNPEKKLHPKETKAEEGIICYLIKNPDKMNDLLEKINPNDFITNFNKKVFSVLVKKLNSSTNFTFSLLADEFNNKEMGKITGIEAKHKDIILTNEVIDDYIKIILDYNNNQSVINNDKDLLELANRLKNKN